MADDVDLNVQRCNRCGIRYVGHLGELCQCGGRIEKIPSESRKQALLVEDSPVDQMKFRRLLSRSGFRVHCEDNGQKGLDWLAERVPDLIVLDLLMPVMGGIETLEAIRSDPRLHDVPVAILTGKSDAQAINAAVQQSVTAFLLKGTDAGTLERRLRHLECRQDPQDVGGAAAGHATAAAAGGGAAAMDGPCPTAEEAALAQIPERYRWLVGLHALPWGK
jgi:CheY-like chemotaxis protein